MCVCVCVLTCTLVLTLHTRTIRGQTYGSWVLCTMYRHVRVSIRMCTCVFAHVLMLNIHTHMQSSLRLHSYEEVVSHVLGTRACTITCLLILIGGIGSLAGYMIIIVDIAQVR